MSNIVVIVYHHTISCTVRLYGASRFIPLQVHMSKECQSFTLGIGQVLQVLKGESLAGPWEIAALVQSYDLKLIRSSC